MTLAQQTGVALAKAGHVVLSGGGCVGMMGALAAGARSVGGHTIGVIPQSLVDLEVADRDADELVVTADMAQRKTVMLARSDAFIALPGGIGTLDELFEVWTIGSLRLHRKPVVIVNCGGFYTGMLDWINRLVAERFVTQAASSLPIVCPDLETALDTLSHVAGHM
jgi:uncharacterized protein (TIGR00730 family)